MCVGRRQRQAQRRQRDHDQHSGSAQRDRAGPAHHPAREPVPAAALGSSRRLRGTALQACRRQRVDSRPERGEHGGQHDQRDRSSGQRHDRAAHPHRVQEAQRHHQHRSGRAGDRQRAVQHGAPGGLQRACDRRARRQATRELLAVAREHEQAVVDPQAQPHAGDEVGGEDREPEDVVDHAQQQERDHDRKSPDQQRQRGGDQSAEDPEGEQQQNRDCEGLGAFEVGGGAFVDFVEGDVVAAEAHAAAGQLGAQMGDRGGRAVLRGECGQHEREAAVARDKRGQVRGGVVELALEAGLGGQQRRHPPRLARGRGGDRSSAGQHVAGGGHERHDAVFGRLPGGVLDRAQHLLVLRTVSLEFGVFALEDREDGGAERGGEQEHNAGDQQDASRALSGKPRQTIDHRRLSIRRVRLCASHAERSRRACGRMIAAPSMHRRGASSRAIPASIVTAN